MKDYLELFNNRRREICQAETGPLDHEHAVEVTFGLSIEQACKAEMLAVMVLNLCAVVAPDAIPRTLLSACGASLHEEYGQGLKDTLLMNRAVQSLKKYSLVTAESASLTIHRLVQAVLRDRMDANALTRCREAMIRALNGQFPDERYREPACWPACEALLPHVKAVVESVADENGAWSETAGLLTGMGAIAMRGLYAEA